MSSSSGGTTSNFVYIPSKEHSWIPARLDALEETQAKVTVSKTFHEDALCLGKGVGGGGGATQQLTIKLNQKDKSLPLQNVNEAGELKPVEDMVDLSFLHEPAILYNLKARHLQGHPYTRTGDIVIAVNPYQWMMELYSVERRRLYSQKLVFDANNNAGTGIIAPHVYESSALAYRGLATTGQDQSILVSGESGAGKTETVKICMNHLASITSAAYSDDDDVGGSSGGSGSTNSTNSTNNQSNSEVVQKVLDSNPLLEAFGNAQTVRNDNSSRFGKYLQLEFEVEDATHAAYAGRTLPSCVLVGSQCEVYLLEKSRVVSHTALEERGYHVFYQLLACAEDEKEAIWKEGLCGGKTCDDFPYVGPTELHSIEGKTDAERFGLTKQALALIGIEGDVFVNFMRVLCMVLQLGNLQLDVDEEEEEQSVIANQEELQLLAELMEVSPDVIAKAVTERTVRARGESFSVPLKPEAACDSRDALAKELYGKAFLWLVRNINAATSSSSSSSSSSDVSSHLSSSSSSLGKIGLLDIFGFESFVVNRFEQLCINYANEKLQQKFTQDIFQTVVAEYEAEGIPLGQVQYQDNASVISFIEGRMGLIAILNEECVRPKGSDVSFVRKITTLQEEDSKGEEPVLVPSKSLRDYEFGIHHYADTVIYDCTGFVQKNMDALPPDLLQCAQQSSNPLLKEEEEEEEGGTKSIFYDPTAASASASAAKKPPQRGQLVASKSSRLVHSTVWTKFKTQLTSLMGTLSQTRTRYIRCIKPNPQKVPKKMDHYSTMEQLKCAGVVAAVTISRSAFPNRLPHEQVYDRFGMLHRKCQDLSAVPVESAIDLLLSHVLKNFGNTTTSNTSNTSNTSDDDESSPYCIGKTRTYFRSGALEQLEAQRLECLTQQAVLIQRFVRKILCLSCFRSLKLATIRCQAAWRGYRTWRTYRIVWYRIVQLQCAVRSYLARSLLHEKQRHAAATRIQTVQRRLVAERLLREVLRACVRMQSFVRGALQRPKYHIELEEAREEAKLENQLKTLQRKLEQAERARLEAEQRAAKAAATPGGTTAAPEPKIIYIEKEVPAAATATAAAAAPQTPQRNTTTDTTTTTTTITINDDIPTTIAATPPPPQSPEAAAAAAVTLTAQQQQLMDESGKMLEYLRKEVFKLRTTNATLRTDFDLLKENNQRLMDANASAGASFAALNQHAKSLAKKNTKLTNELSHTKTLLSKSQLVQVELKEELKLKQQTYNLEVQSRLTYQKGMAQIVETVGERCRDERLVEDVLQLSDDCDDVLHRNQNHLEGGVPNEEDLPENNNNKRRTPSMMSRFTSFLF